MTRLKEKYTKDVIPALKKEFGYTNIVPVDFVADALTREGTGRLYKTLVYDKQLAQSVSVGQDGKVFSGVLSDWLGKRKALVGG